MKEDDDYKGYNEVYKDIAYFAEKEGLDAAGVNAVINKKSGVLGISGVSNDTRDVEKTIEQINANIEACLLVENIK